MGKDLGKSNLNIFFCEGVSCQKAGGAAVIREARAYLRNHQLWETTHTIKTRCNGRCEDAPTCILQPQNYWYKNLTKEKIIEVLEAQIHQNKPIEKYLLYQSDWSKVNSDNPLEPFKPKPFQKVQDNEKGICWITKGFSSDQYLYPLFLYILENKLPVIFHRNEEKSFDLSELISVVYSDAYELELTFTSGKCERVMIGNVPSTEKKELVDQKISSTEYFLQVKNGYRGIRFKNKKGVSLGELKMKNIESIWTYCLQVQLNGLESPQID